MVKKAMEWMHENDFDFVITGEVVGQRPKSQRKETMPIIQKESGIDDRLLRPLCAHNLPETLPEREGWVDRDKLLGFSGRNRKPQMALANALGFEDFAQPAGGCGFLPDASYSSKIQDLWAHYSLDDIILLKVGRHLRPKDNFKMIIARDAGETRYLQGYKKQFPHLVMTSHGGPLTLIEGELQPGDLELAAQIAARFGQGRDAEEVTFSAHAEPGTSEQSEIQLAVKPMPADEIKPRWYV